MSAAVQGAFVVALGGANERVVQIPHPRISFLAQNYNGRPALVAKLKLRPGQVVPDGRGFSVSSDRSGSDSFVRITSTEFQLSLMFIKLVDYILERTGLSGEGEIEPADLLIVSINEFKRFSQRKPGRLTEEEIRGLLAELLLLLRLHDGDDVRTRDLFSSWGGPFGALHDFEFVAGNAVEVKSTHRPPVEIRISSPAQTSPLPDGLDLVVLPLERVSMDTEKAVRFIDVLNEVGALAQTQGGDVLELWESVLVSLGIDITDEYYEQWRFITGDWLRYTVNDDFPRIRDNEVPSGVVKVSYSLRLSALEPFANNFNELEVLP